MKKLEKVEFSHFFDSLRRRLIRVAASVKKLVSIVEILKFSGTFVPVLSQPSFQRTWLILFQIAIYHVRK